MACSDNANRPGPPSKKTDAATAPAKPALDASAMDAALRLDARALRDAADAFAALDDDAGDAALTPAARQQKRGEYIVRHLAGCMECHTPRLASGEFDETKLLSGVEQLVDVEPDDDARGMINSRNLTPDEQTGLGMWTDDQIKRAFRDGLDDQNEVLHWMMPYWIFHNMSDDDADAIVAFLRSIPKIAHEVPENQPWGATEHQPYELPLAQLPQSTLGPSDPAFDSATHGRTLVTSSTPCLLCHTPAPANDPSVPIDVSLAFTGRRKMYPVKLGTPVDKSSPQIESANLTPHAHGLGGWTARDVVTVLRMGVGKKGLPTCDPMPSYMGGSFTGMQQGDALDLGNYFTTLPARDTGEVPLCCTACHGNMSMNDTDAGR